MSRFPVVWLVLLLVAITPLFPASIILFAASSRDTKHSTVPKHNSVPMFRFHDSSSTSDTKSSNHGIKYHLMTLSNKYNPEIRKFFINIFQKLTQNGRGFALVCAGVQQIASSSRLKHVQGNPNFNPNQHNLTQKCHNLTRKAALRAKELKAQRAESDKFAVHHADLMQALSKGVSIVAVARTSLARDGWRSVHESQYFSLFKRRVNNGGGAKKGPVEYLMFGSIENISPRTFLRAQLIKQYREKWDNTMAFMDTIKPASSPIELGSDLSQDIIYYRTRWPWPLKDRDYALARRTKVFPDKKAIVFVSKSIDYPRPHAAGAIRVDNYWCHSTFFSTSKNVPYGKSCLDMPGISYVTVFCDDTKVSLPSSVIDLISKHAEKTVPASMNRLFDFAKSIQ